MENKREFWFIVGSQYLYGNEVLETVEKRACEMAAEMSKAPWSPRRSPLPPGIRLRLRRTRKCRASCLTGTIFANTVKTRITGRSGNQSYVVSR